MQPVLTTLARSFATVCLLLAGTGPLGAAELLSHEAHYALTVTPQYAKRFSDAQGSLMYRIERDCEAWRMAQALRLSLSSPNERDINNDQRFVAEESLTGDRLRFAYRGWNQGALIEDLSGTARRGDDRLSAGFVSPTATVLDLPPDTLFPVAHITDLLAAAQAGEIRHTALMFDGASFEGAYEIVSNIGRPVDLATATPEQQPAGKFARVLGNAGRSWPISMSYYRSWSRELEPDYELQVDLHESGVTLSLVMDYGELVLDAELTSLEAIVSPDC